MSAPRVALVGGGVMGCTLAYALAKRGVRVTLLDGASVGGGSSTRASSVPVALLNPNRGRSARASAFDLESLRAMWALVSELEAVGVDTGVQQSGVLRLASNPKQAKRWAQLPGVRWFGADGVPGEIARGGFHAPFGGFVVPGGGWLLPHRWLAALTQAAVAYGAEVLSACEVSRISPVPEGYTLSTSKGEFHVAAVVLCTGASSLPDLPPGAAALPKVTRVAGEVVGLALRSPLPYPLAGAVYGAWSEEIFYLGGNHRPAHLTDQGAPAQLQHAGGWFLPALRAAPQRSLWSGVRAKTEDNLPVVLELHPDLWLAGALAGRGFLCAAALAGTLAETLATRLKNRSH